MKKLLAKKRNNKGFSLVELIVVILIMAIIAVALAPQVMKWVGSSRDSTDDNNAATIKSAVSAGVADYMADGGKITADTTYYVCEDGLHTGTAYVTSSDTLAAAIAEVMNGDYPEVQNKDASGNEQRFQITIKKDTGSVEVKPVSGTYAPTT